jgi:hypothetical protein
MNIAKLNIFRGFHLRRKIIAAYQGAIEFVSSEEGRLFRARSRTATTTTTTTTTK